MKQRTQNPTGCKEENLIKNRERSKTICSLGLIFAFILLGIIIVTTMALAKYVIKDEKDIEVTLRNVRISENEIEIIPSSWTNENVTVSISTKKNGEVYYKINENGEWKKYEKNFEVEENCNIYAKIKYTDGESPETVKEVTNIDKIKPTVEIVNSKDPITPDIQEYTILAGETTTNISKKLIAKDEGGSGLKTLNYAYSQSNTTEPTTYEEFKNEATVTKSATGGNWYIWTKVLDNAGNRAEETKISPAYNVGYQISYDANGGTGAPKEQRKVHGTELKISETIPTRTGYEFQGWATTNTATTAELKVGGNYTTDKAVKLYAVWKKYKYLNTTTSKYYMKLSDALNEVKDKETIKAMDYAIETTAPTLATAKAITFDLNGQTVIMSNVTLTNNGTLTIAGTNGTLTGSGADTITNNGTATITAGTVSSTDSKVIYNASANAKLTVSGGFVKDLNGDAIYNYADGTVTVTNGTINATGRAVYNNAGGAVNISGGELVSTGSNTIVNGENATGTMTISGGMIDNTATDNAGRPCVINYKGNVVIKDNANINSMYARTVLQYVGDGTIDIQGGTITNSSTTQNTLCYAVGAESGTVKISGGTISSKITNAVRLIVATVNISGGTISTSKGDAVYCASASGKLNISGGTITTTTSAGISMGYGTLTITGGTVKGSSYGIWTSDVNKPTVTIGENDGKISVTTPSITSTNGIGLYIPSGVTCNFYDGKIVGTSGKSISGTVTSTATNCVVIKTTSGSTETAVLGPSAPVITAKLDDANGATYAGGTWTNHNVWVQLKSASIGAGIKEYQWYKNGAWTSSEITTASNIGTILFTATRNETIRFRAIDNNGVVSYETVLGIKIDKTGPTISSVTPATTWDYSNDVTVNATDNESISAYAVTTTKTAPTEWIETTNIDLSNVQTKRENGASWARVFYHNNRGGSTLFANETEAKSVDVSYKYSALGTLDNYKDTTGNWEFMLQYPEIKGKYNRWKQTGNPATTTIANGDGSANAPGYSAVHIDWNYDYWGGLTKSTAPETFLNGSVGMGTWFYAIGVYKGWYGGIPGPNDTAVFQGTELWARIDTLTKANKKTLTAKVGNLTTNGTYYVWVKDHLGNVSSKAVTTNKVDTTAPTAPTITNSSGGNWTNKNVTITLSSTDSQSGVLKYQCKYSGTSNRWADAKSTDTWSAARNETIYYRAIDNAGNVSAVSSTAIKIDKTAPAAPTITNSSGGNWTNQSVTTKVTSTDAMSGIAKYQIKYSGTSNAWRDFDNNNSSHTSWAADRNETLYFRAIDNAGNISAESSTSVKIDKTVPTVTINRTSANTFDWKASDTLSGVAGYAVTTLGSTPTSWTTNGTLTSGTKTISAAGTYYVWIKDKAGNVNKATINAYTVTYDYNGTKNYIVPLSNTIKCTGFSGALNTCFSLGTINKDDLKVGDQLTVSFTASYSGLTGVSGQTVSVIGQGSGNVTAWNPQFPTKENGADRNVHWTGTANNVTYTYRTRALTSSDLTNDSWNFMIRTDYYSAGTITISNVKVTRTTRETKTLLHGATLGTLPAPTERGYTLDGWYTAVTGGTKIATTTTATANATYYAHWAQKGYTITLATNGGTYNGATANSIFAATYGNDVNIGYPVKAGYTFNGWKDSTGKIYDRNLLKNAEAPKEFVDGSKSTNALGGWRTASVSGGTRSVVGYQDPPLPGIRKGFKITASGTATSLDVCQDQVPVTVGKYYTISVWAKGSGGLWLQAGNSSYTGKLFSMSNVTSWTKYSWTFKAGTDGSANNNMTNIYFGNHGATGTIDICGMKLEEGTGFKSTLWANTAANTTLTAQWTANNYTIKIDPNGGKFNNSTSVATYTKTFGSTVAATAPTKTGYTFGGWVPVKTEAGATWAEVLYHNNQGGTTLFANETEVKSVNMAQKYSILGQLETFRANTSSQFEFLLKYDEFGTQYNRWKQTSNPTSGTTISGYSAVSNSWTGDSWGGIAKSSSTSYTFLDGSPNAGTWWYAIGPYQAYKKGIPGPNDTINMESMSLYVKVNDDLSNITKAVTGVVNSSNNYIVRDDITLKAVWIPNTYTITYDKNFLANDLYTNFINLSAYKFYTVSGSAATTEDTSAKYGKVVQLTMNAGTDGGPYLGGSRLTVGTTYTWSVYVKASREITLGLVGQEQGGRKSVKVTTNWQRITYTFKATDNSYNAFVFYDPSGGWKDGDILYIHSLEIAKTSSLNTTTATKNYGNTLSTLPTPTRTGYTWNSSVKYTMGAENTKAYRWNGTGWYTNHNGDTQCTAFSRLASTNGYTAKLTIGWTVNNYTVTYNYGTNGGTSATKTTASVAYGSNVDLTPTATKSGWKFVGWSDPDHPSGTTKLTSYKMPAKNVTLYAIYSKTLTGTFNYYKYQTTKVSTTIYNTATSGTITAPATVGTPPTGYSFRHWARNNGFPNAPKDVDASGKTTISADTTFYASYSKKITITFDDNGAIAGEKVSPVEGTVYMDYVGGEMPFRLKMPEATYGYKMAHVDGWCTTKDGKGDSYKEGQTVSFYNDTTIYAKVIHHIYQNLSTEVWYENLGDALNEVESTTEQSYPIGILVAQSTTDKSSSINLPASKRVTLILNSNTITLSTPIVSNGSLLSIGTPWSSTALTATQKKGTIKQPGNNAAIRCVKGTVNIQGQTTVTSEGNAIEVESGALFQLNDTSAITGKNEGIYSKGGTISISRGTITSTTDNGIHVPAGYGGIVNVNGGTITGAVNGIWNGGSATINVNRGTVIGASYYGVSNYSGCTGTAHIGTNSGTPSTVNPEVRGKSGAVNNDSKSTMYFC